jgi:DNA-binding transcriptional LysR family regulator
MRSLNLDQLRAFVEVVERGSFTSAAEELNQRNLP